MIMKRTAIYIVSLLTAALAVWSCKEQRNIYSDAEYVMFADTMSVNLVQESARTFTVPVASTVACSYDRSFGVEIVDARSKAIEGLHYRLESNTVTIKAGERVANVVVNANYEALEPADTLNFALKLVMPEAVKWNLYGDETNVKMVKSCPFVIEDFEGWCVVTSMFLYDFPGTNTSIQRLIRTEKHPTEENTLILHSMLYDGYDVKIRMEADDPSKPYIDMDEGQVLSDEMSIFYQQHGDNKVLVAASPYYYSYYNTCSRFAVVYLYVYVEDLGDMVGVVDPYAYNILEWVSDEEADRLEREDGLIKRY